MRSKRRIGPSCSSQLDTPMTTRPLRCPFTKAHEDCRSFGFTLSPGLAWKGEPPAPAIRCQARPLVAAVGCIV